MTEAPEHTPVLMLVGAALADLAVRSAMYVARRREAGDAGTFVIQIGEEGRLRLDLPDLDWDASAVAGVAAAQTHLEHYASPRCSHVERDQPMRRATSIELQTIAKCKTCLGRR